ncbi:MAG: LacI family DNA-binding transcriptional regulator [Candidatus Sumerlaeia bacterium]
MIRLKDVAQKAEVSISTVSKILNDPVTRRNFSVECVERVQKAAADLGYTANYHARSLQTGKSQAIGMLVGVGFDTASWDHFWAQLVGGVMIKTMQERYQFIAIGAREEQSITETGLQFLREGRIDGLVVPDYIRFIGDLDILRQTESPVVIIGEMETDFPSVRLDERSGIAKAVEHLHELGHRRVLWAGPDQDTPVVLRRKEAFFNALEEKGLQGSELKIPFKKAHRTSHFAASIARARQTFLEYMDKPLEPTAVMCFEESIAFGVATALREKGLEIPADVSLIGFDDIQADAIYPPMTVVSHMLPQMGRRAASLAIELARDPDNEELLNNTTNVAIEAELVIRQSTGPAPS